MNTGINRRDFLRGAAVISALLMSTRLSGAFADTRRFAPVKLSREISNRAFQLLVGPEYGVRWIETFELLRDGIVLGGTWDHGDWSLTPNVEQANGILQTHMSIMKGLVAPAL